MAKVYALPEELEAKMPKYSSEIPWREHAKMEEEFVGVVQGWAKEQNPNDQYAGVQYRIPHADSYALYVVAQSSPVVLYHIPISDAWDSPWADRVIKKDIVLQVKRDTFLKERFGNSLDKEE